MTEKYAYYSTVPRTFVHNCRCKKGTGECGMGIKYELRTTLVKTVLIGSR